jgi:hypothetical protein
VHQNCTSQHWLLAWRAGVGQSSNPPTSNSTCLLDLPALSINACAGRRELAEESGIQHWGRVPALNTNPTFIDDLADAVAEALPYVGSLQRPAGALPLSAGDSLVPLGEC